MSLPTLQSSRPTDLKFRGNLLYMRLKTLDARKEIVYQDIRLYQWSQMEDGPVEDVLLEPLSCCCL